MVLNRTGQVAAKAASAIFAPGPRPKATVANGIIATEGIVLRNSINGLVAVLATGMLPSSSPAGTATRTARVIAMAQANRVAVTSSRNPSLATKVSSPGNTTVGGGKYPLGARSERPAASQSRRRTI